MIHAVWGTKGRDPFLSNAIRPRVIDHIQENALTKGIYVDILNGHVDHLHCLFGLNPSMSVSKAMQLLKGESESRPIGSMVAIWSSKNLNG